MSGAWKSLLLRTPSRRHMGTYHLPLLPPLTNESHPWPEWPRLIKSVQSAAPPEHDTRILPQDAILLNKAKPLPPHFLTHASALLSFARRNPHLLGLLSNKDIQVIVISGTPFLFRAAVLTAKRMKSFLALTPGNGGEEDKANTVDLMKYLLSYASNPVIPYLQTSIYSREVVESSVRNLLQELELLSSGTASLDKPVEEQTPFLRVLEVLKSGTPSLDQSVEEQTPLLREVAVSNSGIPSLDQPVEEQAPLLREVAVSNSGIPSLDQPVEEQAPLLRELPVSDSGTPSLDQPVEEQTTLLRELAVSNSGTPSLDQPVEEQTQFQYRHAQTSSLHKPNIEMKIGDWICPKCSFMNFARNNQCYECEEHKPTGVLVGGKWECPQCNFFNYERNTFCLSCDCKKPPINSMSEPGYNGDYKYHTSTDRRPPQGVSCSNTSSTTNKDFPEIMPLGRGENRFVVSARKTPLEMRQTNISKDLASGPLGAGKRNVDDLVNRILDKIMGPSSVNSQNGDKGITSGENPEAALLVPKDGVSEASSSISNSREGSKFQISDNSENLNNVINKNKEQEDKSGRWFQRMAELHNVEDLSSAVSDEDFSEIMPLRKDENEFAVSKKITSSLTSPTYRRNIFPLFQVNEKGQLRFSRRALLPKEDDKADTNQVTSDSTNDETANVMDKSASSTISSSQKYSCRVLFPEDNETERLIKSSKMVSGRLVQRMTELRSVLSSSVSDEYFSEVMPVCKGENEFVVSKKKTSSLTFPTYERNMAVGQVSSLEHVPCVPFSPGYVARTEPQTTRGSIATANSADIVPTSPKVTQGYAGMDNSRINQDGAGAIKRIENDHIPSESNIIDAHQGISSYRYASHTSHPQNSAQSLPKTDLRKDAYQFPDNVRASHGEDSAAQNVARSTNVTGNSLHPPANHKKQSGWTGKSLKGSAVKGLETLHMSEEAKAEMWLQRISQMMKISHR